MPAFCSYHRQAAVDYAHRWAYSRNPSYADFETMGGDCTNFASQCLYAGLGVMNFTPTFGWYYLSLNDRAPAWTGAPYFHQFLTRRQESPGPVAVSSRLEDCLPGDFVQLSFGDGVYSHTLVIVECASPASMEQTLIAAHTYDTDYRPLSQYSFKSIRFLHITGGYCP
jgi:hypothetical protein